MKPISAGQPMAAVKIHHSPQGSGNAVDSKHQQRRSDAPLGTAII